MGNSVQNKASNVFLFLDLNAKDQHVQDRSHWKSV